MKVLFDNGTPRSLARHLVARHSVTEARTRGWDRLANGELLSAAENAGFDVLLTTDKNLPYQQNLAGRKIAVVVLAQARWKLIEQHIPRIIATIEAAEAGTAKEVEIPFK